MTLHAFSKQTNRSMKWVATPLELVDWMALHFSGRFITHLAAIDPYGDILIPEELIATAVVELEAARDQLAGPLSDDVPQVVDIFGAYGVSATRTTLQQLIDLLNFVNQNNCKLVSIGD